MYSALIVALTAINLQSYNLYISICVNSNSPSLHIHTSPLFQVELEKEKGGDALVSGPGHCIIRQYPGQRILDLLYTSTVSFLLFFCKWGSGLTVFCEK